ncbi:MAG: pyridoxamine 5'-phosphate oxidase family protein [Ilumatobacteraceae bacterium]
MDATTGRDPDGARLVVLDRATCVALLTAADVGRLGVVDDDGCPVVLPVSYAVVDVDGFVAIAVRTRPGNVLDRPDRPACLEIDGVDPGHDGGWSVLVRGLLRPVAADARFDPHPLLAADRNAWLLLDPTVITGRRLVAPELRWTFHPAGYA